MEDYEYVLLEYALNDYSEIFNRYYKYLTYQIKLTMLYQIANALKYMHN